jgi:protoporphyrinogen oxidase
MTEASDHAAGNGTVVIAGAGPAGLTAALELLRRSGLRPLVFESDSQVGGISKTVNYRGNRMDLGGHRFFSKSDWVMHWWQEILPVAGSAEETSDVLLGYQGQSRTFSATGTGHAGDGRVMIVRPRLSRIYYRRRFFDYPLKLNSHTLGNLGWFEAGRLGASYAQSRMMPRDPEVTLEDFFINRFGDRLYRTFFKDYTEKVWGVPCHEISAEWGAQRVKGLSITRALTHAIRSTFNRKGSVSQKDVETSLIERFLYPRLGPGQMWEEVADRVVAAGGNVYLQHRVVGLKRTGRTIRSVQVLDIAAGTTRWVSCDAFISTMPIQQLVEQLAPEDEELRRISRGLPYRDFMTAGLIVRGMTVGTSDTDIAGRMPPDNWIYVQEPDVQLGRLQIFNNWSPDLVAVPGTVSLGLEYFCREDDGLWSMPDSSFIDMAAAELEKIGLIDRRNVLDGTVVRVPKAYPAYFGEYREISKVRAYLDGLDNLYAVGRNGMHRYNNQDHSMLAGKAAADCLIDSRCDKRNIWSINSEDEYHEERASDLAARRETTAQRAAAG